MRVRHVSDPYELGYKENGMWNGKKIHRDEEGEIQEGWNSKYWRLSNKSLYEMTELEKEMRELLYH